MKSFYVTFFFLAFFALVAAAQNPVRSFKTSTITGKRTALVIGNAAYQHANPLKNPLNDANAMETTLKELGFEVKKLANANRSSLKEAINQWGQTLANYDVALFFYAGHALEIDGTNFLCPVNANPLNRAQVEDETITMRMVTGWMEEARTKTNIILLDACRDNPFRSFRSNEGGLANMSAPSGTFIGFAATPGKKASDGDRTNGLYTEAILKAIKTPNQTIDQSFNQVNAYVRQASGGAQVPFKNSSLEADFYFVVTENANVSNQKNYEDLLNQGVEATNKNDRKKAVDVFKKAGALANGFGLSDEKAGKLYE
ncbi:caspase family protein, partial [Runella sp.]|uniref:caspase family protein n=1 Tax=Runella sp. TaxID=1960881 RepID=UPI0030185D28